jgi:hypothetical protein
VASLPLLVRKDRFSQQRTAALVTAFHARFGRIVGMQFTQRRKLLIGTLLAIAVFMLSVTVYSGLFGLFRTDILISPGQSL